MTARTTSVDVVLIPTRGPGDVSGLINLIDAGKIAPASILAILGKTEGNGGVNDFTREFAVSALCAALAPRLGLTPHQVEQKIAFVMSGGTEGVLSPHLTVFTRTATEAGEAISGKRLSIGIAQTRDFLPEELGRRAQIDETASAVRAAMTAAASMASRITSCPMTKRLADEFELPSTITTLCISSIPADVEATDENRLQSFSTCASRISLVISPSARATPSADAPRE